MMTTYNKNKYVCTYSRDGFEFCLNVSCERSARTTSGYLYHGLLTVSHRDENSRLVSFDYEAKAPTMYSLCCNLADHLKKKEDKRDSLKESEERKKKKDADLADMLEAYEAYLMKKKKREKSREKNREKATLEYIKLLEEKIDALAKKIESIEEK